MIQGITINTNTIKSPPSYFIDFAQMKQDVSLYLTSSKTWERNLGEMIYQSDYVDKFIHKLKSCVGVNYDATDISAPYYFIYNKINDYVFEQRELEFLLGSPLDRELLNRFKSHIEEASLYFKDIGLIDEYNITIRIDDMNCKEASVWIHSIINNRHFPSIRFDLY